MDARFEDDMIELAADDNCLMLCGGRKTLFLEGVEVGQIALADIDAFRAHGATIVVRLASGDTRAQPFPSAPEGFLAEAAEKLNDSAAAWR